MNIIKSLKKFHFRVFESIDLELLESKKEGIWYHYRNTKANTILFLRLLIVNPEIRNLKKLLDLIGCGEEVIGYNDCSSNSFLEIRRSGFNQKEQKQAKEKIMSWMRKKGIKGILFLK